MRKPKEREPLKVYYIQSLDILEIKFTQRNTRLGNSYLFEIPTESPFIRKLIHPKFLPKAHSSDK